MTRSSIAVLTPTLPDRSELLLQAKASVEAQTIPVEHLVWVDEVKEGPSAVRNRLAASTDAEWLLPLDDDDLLEPECAETLLAHSEGYDVVYPWCHVEGSNWSPNRLFRESSMRDYNFIPVTALVSRELWEGVGGWKRVPRAEDWLFWRECIAKGARFKCLPEILWTYRVGASGTSRNGWTPAAPATARS